MQFYSQLAVNRCSDGIEWVTLARKNANMTNCLFVCFVFNVPCNFIGHIRDGLRPCLSGPTRVEWDYVPAEKTEVVDLDRTYSRIAGSNSRPTAWKAKRLTVPPRHRSKVELTSF